MEALGAIPNQLRYTCLGAPFIKIINGYLVVIWLTIFAGV